MSKELEALKCLENFIEECKTEMYNYAELQNGYQYEKYQYRKEQLENIKQALIKAQEPKQYLKWEDLEFARDEKVMLVKMGDTVYKVLYRCCDGIEEVQVLSKDEKLLCLNLIGKYKDNIRLFNDLHLERVEE